MTNLIISRINQGQQLMRNMTIKRIIIVLLFTIYLFACQNNTEELNYLPSEEANYKGENIEFQLPGGDKIAL